MPGSRAHPRVPWPRVYSGPGCGIPGCTSGIPKPGARAYPGLGHNVGFGYTRDPGIPGTRVPGIAGSRVYADGPVCARIPGIPWSRVFRGPQMPILPVCKSPRQVVRIPVRALSRPLLGSEGAVGGAPAHEQLMQHNHRNPVCRKLAPTARDKTIRRGMPPGDKKANKVAPVFRILPPHSVSDNAHSYLQRPVNHQTSEP